MVEYMVDCTVDACSVDVKMISDGLSNCPRLPSPGITNASSSFKHLFVCRWCLCCSELFSAKKYKSVEGARATMEIKVPEETIFFVQEFLQVWIWFWVICSNTKHCG